MSKSNMGGLIEDRIFEVLMSDKLTASEVKGRLETISHESRSYGIVSKHLRKMCYLKQLDREKNDAGKYVYYNPCIVLVH